MLLGVKGPTCCLSMCIGVFMPLEIGFLLGQGLEKAWLPAYILSGMYTQSPRTWVSYESPF